MPLASIYTRATRGIDAPLVTVEVQLTGGLYKTSIVGLTETAVKEASFRVRSALRQAGFELPDGHVIVHLAPAGLRKEGGRYDLPIALGILAASGQIPQKSCDHHEFFGELGLDGSLRSVAGVLPAALQAQRYGRAVFVPAGNATEAALAQEAAVYGARNLPEVCAHVCGREYIQPAIPPAVTEVVSHHPDLADLRGQPQGRRALELAAAGAHNLLLIGPPGTGKSMLAQRLPGILPPMTRDEALASAAVASVSAPGFDPQSGWGRRPFRDPHHSASAAAIVGGGTHPLPGEISLAHHGVLFLDELPEYSRVALEVLREPLESGRIMLSRARQQVEYPARFQLIAAMNPCPCGYLGDPDGHCRCTPEQVERYRNRVSGPLLDRIDMHVEVPRLSSEVLTGPPDGEDSATVRARVMRAREIQQSRQGVANARLDRAGTEAHCTPDRDAQALIERAIDQLGLSARAYHRLLRLARTIADLDDADGIRGRHMAEAIGYRKLDRRPIT